MRKGSLVKFFRGLFFIQLLVFGAKSVAITVSPMEASFGVSEESRSVTYTVGNDSDKATAVEVSITTREIDTKTGKEINLTNDDIKKDFSIFPAALLLKPGQKKGIRVTYNLKEQPKTEKSYRIIISEKPIKGEKLALGTYKVLGIFKTPAYVVPEVISTAVKIDSFVENDGSIDLRLSNTGTAHLNTKSIQIRLKDDQKNSVVISESEEASLKQNYLAGSSLRVKVSKPKELKGNIVFASIEVIE